MISSLPHYVMNSYLNKLFYFLGHVNLKKFFRTDVPRTLIPSVAMYSTVSINICFSPKIVLVNCYTYLHLRRAAPLSSMVISGGHRYLPCSSLFSFHLNCIVSDGGAMSAYSAATFLDLFYSVYNRVTRVSGCLQTQNPFMCTLVCSMEK